jgi:hypothetical protein
VTYQCCVCKGHNTLTVDNITVVGDLQNMINDLSSKYLDTIAELEDDLLVSSPVILHYPPVLTTNDVTYCGANIILHQTHSNYFKCLEIIGGTSPNIGNLVDAHAQLMLYDIDFNPDFYYVTNIYNAAHSRLQLTLLPNVDFLTLVWDKMLRI